MRRVSVTVDNELRSSADCLACPSVGAHLPVRREKVLRNRYGLQSTPVSPIGLKDQLFMPTLPDYLYSSTLNISTLH